MHDCIILSYVTMIMSDSVIFVYSSISILKASDLNSNLSIPCELLSRLAPAQILLFVFLIDK